MARYFKEQDIDEFRECFYLFARSGQITSLDELTVVMRSLGMSPTIQELAGYLKGKGGKMSFADFLEVMHIHSRAENLPNEKEKTSNHNLKKNRNFDPSSLPPFKAELYQHLLRVRYVTKFWRNAHLKHPTSLLPQASGWTINDDKYDFIWFVGEQLPSLVADIIIKDNNLLQNDNNSKDDGDNENDSSDEDDDDD